MHDKNLWLLLPDDTFIERYRTAITEVQTSVFIAHHELFPVIPVCGYFGRIVEVLIECIGSE